MSRLSSIREAAKDLNVSKETIRRLAEQGEIRYVRVSRRVMIPVSELDRVVREGTRNTRPDGYRNPKAFPKKVAHARPAL
jgi:excisionase family DNA binding protein